MRVGRVGEGDVPGAAPGVEPLGARLPGERGEWWPRRWGRWRSASRAPRASRRGPLRELVPGARHSDVRGRSNRSRAVEKHHGFDVERDAEDPALEGGQGERLRQQLARRSRSLSRSREVPGHAVDRRSPAPAGTRGWRCRGVAGPGRVAELGVAALCAEGTCWKSTWTLSWLALNASTTSWLPRSDDQKVRWTGRPLPPPPASAPEPPPEQATMRRRGRRRKRRRGERRGKRRGRWRGERRRGSASAARVRRPSTMRCLLVGLTTATGRSAPA